MAKVFRFIVLLPAILFFVIGVRWLVDPASVAPEFGMPLLDGLGRSTQIGDLAAFFISISLMVFIGVATEKRAWLLAPAMLVGLTAVFRLIAWLAHDAALAREQIGVEVVVTVLLLLAAAFTAADAPKDTGADQ